MADDPVWGSQTELTAAIALADDDVLGRDASDTTDDATGTVGRVKWQAALGLSGITPGGRLTLESGVPISTTDQTAKGTLYYCPYVHDYVRLYNGTRPTLYQFTERSLSLTLTSGKNYDVFLYDNSGTLTPELSAAWTNDTTRADALAWQAGVGYVKSGTATRLYLGTIRASGTNTTESSFLTTTTPKSFVWNAYNRVPRTMKVVDTTDSWNYTTETLRYANNSAANRAEVVQGLAIRRTKARVRTMAFSASTPNVRVLAGIGIDSSTVSSAMLTAPHYNTAAGGWSYVAGEYSDFLSAGYHYVAWLESAQAVGTISWMGDNGVSGFACGMAVEIEQ